MTCIESGVFNETFSNRGVYMGDDFFADWLKVAADKAKNFNAWSDRLKAEGSHYGAYEGHSGLWDLCVKTQHDVLARLAIVHMVAEGHGLDAAPKLIVKMNDMGDEESCNIARQIERDEATHVYR